MNNPIDTEVTTEELIKLFTRGTSVVEVTDYAVIADRLQQQADEIARFKEEIKLLQKFSVTDVDAEINTLTAKLDKANKTIQRYAWHQNDQIIMCDKYRDSNLKCTCGYSEALTELEETDD